GRPLGRAAADGGPDQRRRAAGHLAAGAAGLPRPAYRGDPGGVAAGANASSRVSRASPSTGGEASGGQAESRGAAAVARAGIDVPAKRTPAAPRASSGQREPPPVQRPGPA